MRKNIPEEKGTLDINDHHMKWTMKRSKGESAFGIRGSRIFELLLYRDDLVACEYERGWIKKPSNEDEETALCLSHLIQTYGKEKKRPRKNLLAKVHGEDI